MAKPLLEQFTLRLTEDLLTEIEDEAARREEIAGVPISRGALVRLLIRLGLRTVRTEAGACAPADSDAL